MKALLAKVLSKYPGSSFEEKGRIKSFFNFTIILIPSLIIILIAFNIVTERTLFDKLNILVLIFILTSMTAFIIMFFGHYYIAVNLISIILLIGLCLNSINIAAGGSPGRLLATTLPTVTLVVFVSVFASVRMFLTLSAGILILNGVMLTHFRIFPAGEIGIIRVDYFLTVILTTVLCYMTRRINYTARRLRSEETDSERKNQLEINRNLIESLRKISETLDESSSHMSVSSTTFSENIQNQAAIMEEIAASIEEISSGSENISDSVDVQAGSIESLNENMSGLLKLTQFMAEKTSSALLKIIGIVKKAEAGEKFINDMDISMKEINSTSGEMSNILNIINDISDKINLLSLNASIEAARAGDAGRGFAVVAQEISKLADQTSASVKDIDRLIKKSESEVDKGMTNVTGTIEAISVIMSGVTDIKKMITEIDESMGLHLKSSSTVVNEADAVKLKSIAIKDSAFAQRKGAEEMVNAITNANLISQSNAESSQGISSNSSLISGMSADIRSKLSQFDIEKIEAMVSED